MTPSAGRGIAAILGLLALAAGCGGASERRLAVGTVRFEITGEEGMNLASVPVAVMPSMKGTTVPSRTERLDLVDGKGALVLDEGGYDLWVGARMSPDSRSARIVPDMVSVEVRADRPALVRSSLSTGGVARVPGTMGVPPASLGRLPVRCTRGAVTLRRWIALRPNDATEDMVWPPLPKGEWDLVVEMADGSGTALRAVIDGKDPGGVEATRR